MAIVAIVPLFVLLLASAVNDRRRTLDAAKTHALDRARLGAQLLDESFRHAKEALTVLRSLPQITNAGPAECHAALRAVAANYPQLTSIGIVDTKGDVPCLSLDVELKPFRDTQLLRAALAAGPSTLSIGKFLIGRYTGKPSILTALPLPAATKDAPPPGIVYASLDLDPAAFGADEFASSDGGVLSIVDLRDANLLVRMPDPGHWSGKVTAGSALFHAMLAQPHGGIFETIDLEGAPMIFGLAPLVAGGPDIMAAVGLSRAAVLADADERLLIGVAFAVLAAIGVAGAAWLIGDRTQLRPIRALLETGKQLGAGNLAARADMAPWQAPEFRALSETLGEMAARIARAQRELRDSERELRLLAEHSIDMIMRIRQDGRRLYVSPACRTMLGFEPEEMLRMPSKEAIHPDDADILKDWWSLHDGTPAKPIYRMRRKDGSYLWVERSVSQEIPVEPGQGPQRIVVIRDVEHRVADEQRIRESERRYRLLAEYSIDMVFQNDIDLTRRYVSPACREVLGYEPEDMLRRPGLSNMHPDDRDCFRAATELVVSGRAPVATVISRQRHRDGHLVWTESRLRLLKDPATGAMTVIGAVQDISLRKAAEEQLEEANRRLKQLASERFRQVVESAAYAIVTVDAQGRIDLVNAQAERLFGLARTQLWGMQMEMLFPERLRQRHVELRKAFFEDPQPRPMGLRRDLFARGKDGREVPVEIGLSLIETDAGAMILFSIVDISARERLLEELERKNNELEAFTYSVSHDLRAPLRGIDGFSQALLEDYGEQLDARGQGYLGRIRAAAQRMGGLIDDLTKLSRIDRVNVKRERIDVSALARLVLGDLANSEPSRAAPEATIEEGLTGEADGRLLRIVLENLLGNAWKFTSKTANPRIEFGLEESAKGRAFFTRDNGAGFDMAYADKLFGVFQRLHGQEEFPGTGIGLATVQRIIQRHGGRVWAEGRVGVGATFYFTL